MSVLAKGRADSADREPDNGASAEAGDRSGSSELDDAVAAACNGDLGAWERLYRELFDPVYRHVCFLTGDPVGSEDLVQETFGRAMASIESFNGLSRFSTWLKGVATNVVRMHARHSKRRRRAHERLESVDRLRFIAGESPDAAHLRRRRFEVLYAVLETMPDHLREAFILRDVLEVGGQEAADQIGITAGNLAVRLHRARVRVRDELERLGWAPEEGVA